mmetsp:Transcript_6813/g.23798  ORF Transcript_6813/g.23798 Transcript_6813/m.23798 type:complete len:257 (-) Transcript_6813:2247-3017(-)
MTWDGRASPTMSTGSSSSSGRSDGQATARSCQWTVQVAPRGRTSTASPSLAPSARPGALQGSPGCRRACCAPLVPSATPRAAASARGAPSDCIKTRRGRASAHSAPLARPLSQRPVPLTSAYVTGGSTEGMASPGSSAFPAPTEGPATAPFTPPIPRWGFGGAGGLFPRATAPPRMAACPKSSSSAIPGAATATATARAQGRGCGSAAANLATFATWGWKGGCAGHVSSDTSPSVGSAPSAEALLVYLCSAGSRPL